MSLQIRRGIESQRTGVVFDEGEISWTTDTKKLYVGDGTTAGGVNVIASAAGTGLTWNNTTQTLNFSGSGLGLTTDVVTEGVTYNRIYFTNARAKTAVSSMFTTLGTSPTTGNVTGAISPSQITVSGGTSGMNPYIPFTVTGTGGQGLTAGTYYICTIVDSTHVTLSSTLLLAQAGTAIASFTTGSITGTTYSAGGGGGDVYFTYNPTTQTISANVTLDGVGILSVSQDTSPSLGGNLTLAGYNIVGTVSGNSITINGTTGAVTAASFTGPHTGTTTGILNGNVISATSTTIIDNTAQTLSLRPTVGLFANLYAISSSGNLPYILINASNGTYTTPTASIANDVMGGIQWTGYNGTSYNLSSVINTVADGTVVNGNVPGKLQLGVQNSTGTGIQAMTFNSLGILSVPSMTAGLNIRQVNAITIATTSTYSLSSTKSVNLLLVTAGVLTATLNMPTSPVDGQECKFSVSGNAVTLAVGTGTTAPTFSGAASVGTVFTYVYQATTTTWYRL